MELPELVYTVTVALSLYVPPLATVFVPDVDKVLFADVAVHDEPYFEYVPSDCFC